ncbi:glycoside hydrolase family 88/105 protein [Christiangramia flava]|uniref:Rhamnogalacturonides degradation protein RhiN n=1 Tax=Christiangramia flava JLT2011 TaxID=1229726 RepID=A0A1L7I5L9_9FLAO|nr:glycoside hydrolase family 88 protein [Christiangramia flava]APU68900.1 Rhamnogalacturonides degradation protein RhiN [Christiangramia flava JLT2011]OSS38954.1 Rhamnogalacturonides degradation protein RhiN [Christiangramia flava JLT2011]
MTYLNRLIPVLFGIFFISVSVSCKNSETEKDQAMAETETKVVSDSLKWSERMMLSEMERFPEASKLDFRDKPKWSYTNGLVLKAAKEVYEKTGKQQYYDYLYAYADTMITDQGAIRTYKLSDQNLDMLNSGNVLLYLYPKTKEERFLEALKTLRSQIDTQPRTSDGGFWHKKRYTHQMWLDGLYMAEPFYAHYTQMFSDGETAKKAYDDIVHQFDLIQEHSLDQETGLLYHGWDESREQKWTNKETGTSPHFWSRAMGWYGMALVDVLDYLPEDHPGREKLINYLKQFSEAVVAVQDEKSGLWYQVLDQGDREGNYLEASGSSMFVYTFAKAVSKGYISQDYQTIAEKGYQGILDNLISVEENGIVNLNEVCAVAGLGGEPYRDASFEYYVNEEIRSNDPKGTGPFILASLQLDR